MPATDFCHLKRENVYPNRRTFPTPRPGSRRGSAPCGLGHRELDRTDPEFHGPGKGFGVPCRARELPRAKGGHGPIGPKA